MATSKTGGTNSQGAGGAGKRTGAAGGSRSGAGGAGDGRVTTPGGATAGETGAGAARTRAAGATSGATSTGKRSAAGKSAGKTAAKADGKARGGTAAKSGATTKSGTRAGGAARKRAAGAGGGSLQRDLREWVQAHPGGWGHNEWIGLVNLLRERGHDTSDTDGIGMALERERLKLVLERVPGLGPQRVNAIADRYPRLWNLMQANADEIASVASLPRAVAEKVREAIH